MNFGEKKYHGYNKIDDGRLLFTADYTDHGESYHLDSDLWR